MRLLDELRSEHERIERTLGAFRTWADRFVSGEAPPADGREFLTFFRVYAGAFHHDREEEVLFPALVHEASLPGDRGPIAVLLAEHREMAGLLAEVEGLLASPGLDDVARASVRDVVVAYSHALWHHIDAENSVLLPESEDRLGRTGVTELPGREPSEAESAAAALGDALALRYPPLEDPQLVRGDGCALCPSYGVRCEGVEREWWTDAEWEEHDEHIASS